MTKWIRRIEEHGVRRSIKSKRRWKDGKVVEQRGFHFRKCGMLARDLDECLIKGCEAQSANRKIDL